MSEMDDVARRNALIRGKEREQRYQQAQPQGPSPERLAELREVAEATAIQIRADSVYRLYGQTAPQLDPDESLLSYRKRLVGHLRVHTDNMQLDFTKESEAVFADSEAEVYRQAAKNWMRPGDLPAGELREVIHQEGPRAVSYFVGGRGSGSMFSKVFAPFRGVGQKVVFLIDDVPQKYSLSPPVLKE
jgi:hypothetical protein